MLIVTFALPSTVQEILPVLYAQSQFIHTPTPILAEIWGVPFGAGLPILVYEIAVNMAGIDTGIVPHYTNFTSQQTPLSTLWLFTCI